MVKTMKTQTPMKTALVLFLCLIFFYSSLSYASENKRIIVLETMPVPVVLAHTRWLSHYLDKMGYQVGKSLDLEVLQANGDVELAETILKKAINNNKPDLVVASATLASKAAVKILKGTDVPVLFMTVSDPVGAGLINEIGVSTGTNITGRVHMIDRKTKIDMVMQLIGQKATKRPIRFGFIHSSYPSAVGDIRELKAIAASSNDIEFISYQVPYRKVPEGMPEMLNDAKIGVEKLKDKVDYWWSPSGPLAEVDAYIDLLLDNSNIQIVSGATLQSVKKGVLTYLSPDQEGTGKEVAMIADSILKGHLPGDIKVTYPESMILGINLSTAMKMNIAVPMDIMELAGENIYR
jgi:putative ABC transport system substrate-binding protein